MSSPRRLLSRRALLAGGAGLVAAGAAGLLLEGGGSELAGLIEGEREISAAWQSASQSNETWLAANASVLANLRLGCSFAPEVWDADANARAEPLAGLRFAVEDLGLHEVRLGLRWDAVQRADGSIDLAAYAPYLDYCFANEVGVCLNVGPVRVFRWPEDHVPDFVLQRYAPPKVGGRIEAGSALAIAAYGYLAALLARLQGEYGDKLLGLRAVQPENEPFFPFGAHEWTMSDAYLAEVIHLLDLTLPGVPLLLTSAGRLSLDAITGLFEKLIASDRRYGNRRLISGFDYHYKTPHLEEYPIVRHLDPIAFAFRFPPAMTCAGNIVQARRLGYAIEVSEGEAEPTGAISSPGNSARDFRFMLQRCATKVVDPQQTSLLRIWGVEYLAQRFAAGSATDEHQQIRDLVRSLTAAD